VQAHSHHSSAASNTPRLFLIAVALRTLEFPMEFPYDENGDVLRQLCEAGMDMSAEHDIDFWHLFDDQEDAEEMVRRVGTMGIQARTRENRKSSGWDVQCIVSMVPTHAAITQMERKLAEIADDCGGHPQGWGVLQK
jgi:Regulator of ribonuclease activity B